MPLLTHPPPSPRYVAHRSLIVAGVRFASAALLLLHVYLDPCESSYSTTL